MSLGFAAPQTLGELATLLAPGAGPWLIAGGTDRLIAPATPPESGLVVDLTRLEGIAEIAEADGRLILGAGVTVARLTRDRRVARLAPVLCQAAEVFGSVQIRNRATIGGNVAHGSPAADLVPALLAAGATVRLWRLGATESLPLEVMLARQPVLGPREVILGFDLPAGDPAPRGAFVKLGPRQEPAISRLTLAAAGPAGQMRLYAGAIGAIPLRLTAAEAVLNAGSAGFAAAVAEAVAAANPGRASTAYKARAVRGLAEDLLERLDGARP
ncbi:FAD binding domain-containing protein [Albidovulum sp.]|uniref:FAD binding domain-containing protein n=1 Tax=Albidovulum sp. TaxID=1872424 RepID=UPI0039B9618A